MTVEATENTQQGVSDKKEETLNQPKESSDKIVGFIVIALLIYCMYWVWNWAFGDEQLYKPKSQVKTDISKMIDNGADLDSLKHYFSSNFDQEWGLLYRWNNKKSKHYTKDTSLLTVLKDIKNQNYLKDSIETSKTTATSTLIAEYQERNPFDDLEVHQKDMFDNIRVKLGEKYPVVANDLNKLSDEILQKNKLVTQYLSDSQTSLGISIASLAFGVGLPILSMLFSRRKLFSKIFTQ